MGKLRNWCLHRRQPSAVGTNQPGFPSDFSSVALRLSDVAPALNALLHTPTGAALPRTFSLPVVKLPNSQEHKDELLKRLLHGSTSSSGGAHPLEPPRGRRSQSSGSRSKPADIGSDRKRKRNNISKELRQKPGDKDALTRREKHIYSERQRRKGMTHMYATMRSLLPDGKAKKTDRCTCLRDAKDYIQSLQKKLEELARQRSEIMASVGDHLPDAKTPAGMPNIVISDDVKEQLLTAADVTVRFSARDAFITLKSPKRKGIWSGILQVLHEQNLEILNVNLSTSTDTESHCIHAKVPVASELRSQDLQKMLQNLVVSHAISD